MEESRVKQWHWYLLQGVVFLAVGVFIWTSMDAEYVWYSVVTLVVVFAASVVGFLAAWRERQSDDTPGVEAVDDGASSH